MANKKEIIDQVNNIKNTPIAELKKNPVKNSSGKNHVALIQYNTMLDNITIGAHTNTTIEFAGIEWTLRLLTGKEFINVKNTVNNQAREEEIFDEFYTYYLTMIKILCKALSPSPFNTEGEEIFSEEDLQLINYDVLEELYRRYIDFVDMATKKADDFTEEQIQALIDIIKKKPEHLRELDRPRLLTMSRYFQDYSASLEKIIKSGLDN